MTHQPSKYYPRGTEDLDWTTFFNSDAVIIIRTLPALKTVLEHPNNVAFELENHGKGTPVRGPARSDEGNISDTAREAIEGQTRIALPRTAGYLAFEQGLLSLLSQRLPKTVSFVTTVFPDLRQGMRITEKDKTSAERIVAAAYQGNIKSSDDKQVFFPFEINTTPGGTHLGQISDVVATTALTQHAVIANARKDNDKYKEAHVVTVFVVTDVPAQDAPMRDKAVRDLRAFARKVLGRGIPIIEIDTRSFTEERLIEMFNEELSSGENVFDENSPAIRMVIDEHNGNANVARLLIRHLRNIELVSPEGLTRKDGEKSGPEIRNILDGLFDNAATWIADIARNPFGR